MTMRWMHPHEIERQRARDRFDPAREGDRHGLSREVSLAIWERVCAEATDGSGHRDVEQAERRFHEIAALVAVRGGTLGPDIGRFTRVGVELGGMPLAAWRRELLARPAPGRETLVTRAEAERAAEARQDSARPVRGEAATSEAASSEAAGPAPRAVERPEAPSVSDVAQQMAALMRPSAGEPPLVLDRSELGARRRGPRAALAAWSVPGRDPERRDGRLPAATRARMEQAYGQRFDDVEIHLDSAEVPAGREAFTRGRHIYFERGAFDPDTEHGDHVIAHELAHVAQQSRAGGDGGPVASRGALEADAHQAALAALAGRAASVNLFAPAGAALAFSDGEVRASRRRAGGRRAGTGTDRPRNRPHTVGRRRAGHGGSGSRRRICSRHSARPGRRSVGHQRARGRNARGPARGDPAGRRSSTDRGGRAAPRDPRRSADVRGAERADARGGRSTAGDPRR